jgi:hypothetical protein
LNCAWKKFWQFTSIVMVIAVAATAAPTAGPPNRANELTLAGLRPGRDKIVSPAKTFRGLEQDTDSSDAFLWGDICTHRQLRIEVGEDHVIRTITAAYGYKPEIMAKCLASVMEPKRLKLLETGHGLVLGDACSKAIETYGKPESESPSVKSNEELELYFYAFDWAGSDVPQVLDVSCSSATGKVVEIMLAASSL